MNAKNASRNNGGQPVWIRDVDRQRITPSWIKSKAHSVNWPSVGTLAGTLTQAWLPIEATTRVMPSTWLDVRLRVTAGVDKKRRCLQFGVTIEVHPPSVRTAA